MTQTQVERPVAAVVRLRAGGPDDAPGLAAMLRDVGPESGFLRFFTGVGAPKPALLRGLLATTDRRGAVLATAGGAVVGHACWSVDDEGVADLGVLVADAWQRRGVGRRLLAAAATRACAAGGLWVHLDVHPQNRGVVRVLRERLPGAQRRFADGLVQLDAPLADLLGALSG